MGFFKKSKIILPKTTGKTTWPNLLDGGSAGCNTTEYSWRLTRRWWAASEQIVQQVDDIFGADHAVTITISSFIGEAGIAAPEKIADEIDYVTRANRSISIGVTGDVFRP
jgi:hypothetical protein